MIFTFVDVDFHIFQKFYMVSHIHFIYFIGLYSQIFYLFYFVVLVFKIFGFLTLL